MSVQWIDPCVAMASWDLLMVWGAVLAVPMLAWPWLVRMSPTLRKRLVIGAMVFMATFGARPAEATVVGSGCKWMNEQQWPCFVIEALWCPCTWDDEGEGTIPW